MFLDFYAINKTCPNRKCPFTFSNIGGSIVGPSPSSSAVLVVMSSHLKGPLFFDDKMCHKPYHNVNVTTIPILLEHCGYNPFVGNLMIAEYQVEKLRGRVTEKIN